MSEREIRMIVREERKRERESEIGFFCMREFISIISIVIWHFFENPVKWPFSAQFLGYVYKFSNLLDLTLPCGFLHHPFPSVPSHFSLLLFPSCLFLSFFSPFAHRLERSNLGSKSSPIKWLKILLNIGSILSAIRVFKAQSSSKITDDSRMDFLL